MEIWIWRAIGLLGQGLFFSRFLIQWIASERKKESVIPVYFWYLSLSGGIILLSYAIHIRDPIFILGQSCGALVYTRNLVLIFRKKRIEGEQG
jgi:lipid-A-disaccharide synthase-like uncharacterized protein